MTKRFSVLTLIAFLSLSSVSYAQSAWDKYFGGTSYDAGKKLLKTTDGNLIIGAEEASADGIAGQNLGKSDITVFKCTPEGDILWSIALGGTGTEDFGDIVPTNDGGYMVVGTTDSPDGDIKTNGGQMDMFIAKLSSEGVFEWTRSYGGSGNDRGFNVLPIYDGGYLISGEVGSMNGHAQMPPFGGIDGWIIRIDKTGRIVWERRFGGASIDRINNVYPIASLGIRHNFRVIGTSMSSDNHVQQNKGGQDIWVFNMDEYGRLIGWQKSYGGEKDEDSHTSLFDYRDSTLTIAGTTYSSTGDVTTQKGGGDAWMFKIAANGDLIWSQTYGGSKQEGASDVKRTYDGGYLLCGMTKSKDGDIKESKGDFDAYMLKTDAQGKIQFFKTAGYEKKEYLSGCVDMGSRNFLGVGMSELGNNGAQIMEHNGKYDIWLCSFTDSLKTIDTAKNAIKAPTLTGIVYEKETRKPLKVYIKLTGIEKLDSLQSVASKPEDGEYLMVLPTKGKVSFGTLKEGYIFYGEDLDLDVLSKRPNAVLRKNIELDPIANGKTFNLNRVYFKSNEANLQPESNPELERLVSFMKLNPTLNIKLSGYASFQNDGADKYNLALNRANSVKSYLTTKGIKDTRIVTDAGDINRQLYESSEEVWQAKNRRVEVTITGL